jgi:heptosyltransferase-2
LNRILIRATNWVGDAVMSLPALHALRQRFSGAHIAILARPWISDLYAREAVCDRVIPYTPAPGRADLLPKWNAARELAKEHFDAAILFPNSFESAIVARLAGIPRVIGYNRDARGFLLTDSIPVPTITDSARRHERFYYLELLKRAGLITDYSAESRIRLTPAPGATADLLRARQIKLPLIGVSPGAAYGTAKRWLPERFAESASELSAALDARVAVFGSAAERNLCETVAQSIGPQAHNLAGQTSLREFIDLAAACRIFITNDSGAMHIASALGVPSVTVFGSTDDVTTGPTSPLARIVREPVECSPCLRRECPIDHRCMTRIPASRVITVALELLKC